MYRGETQKWVKVGENRRGKELSSREISRPGKNIRRVRVNVDVDVEHGCSSRRAGSYCEVSIMSKLNQSVFLVACTTKALSSQHEYYVNIAGATHLFFKSRRVVSHYHEEQNKIEPYCRPRPGMLASVHVR